MVAPCLNTLIEDASALSSTIRALVARIERSDLIVHVRCRPLKSASLVGRLMFLAAILGQRYVVIEVKRPEQWHTQVATIAHELQHAVEVADALWIRDQATMAQYYRQTGITVARKPLVFDTLAARHVGRRVQRELAAAATSTWDADRDSQR